MDTSEAARILVEKVRPWVQHFPEWRAAIDALVGLVEDRTMPEPEYPYRTPDEKAVDALYAGFEDGWRAARLHYSVDTDASDAEIAAKARIASRKAYAPAAPKVGDSVPDYAAAINLPPGTTIDTRDGNRGLVIEHPDALMRIAWTRRDIGGRRWPATIAGLPTEKEN